MGKSDQVLIRHILEAIGKIEGYIDSHSFESFKEDTKTLDAIAYELMIIGEATANISDETKEKYSHVPFSEAMGMRNRIVHEYWAVKNYMGYM